MSFKPRIILTHLGGRRYRIVGRIAATTQRPSGQRRSSATSCRWALTVLALFGRLPDGSDALLGNARPRLKALVRQPTGGRPKAAIHGGPHNKRFVAPFVRFLLVLENGFVSRICFWTHFFNYVEYATLLLCQ